MKTSNRLLRLFLDISMSSGHFGLSEIARAKGLDLANLKLGEYVVFINKRRNALKMFASGNMLAHLKLPEKQRIDMRTISVLPHYFNGGELKYDAALKDLLKKEFPNLRN